MKVYTIIIAVCICLSLNAQEYANKKILSSFSVMITDSSTFQEEYSCNDISLEMDNKGQLLELTVSNYSDDWIGIDASSISYFIYFYRNGEIRQYSGNDFKESMGTLFSFDRNVYDLIVLPPASSVKVSFYRIDGATRGNWDIISDVIMNNSRMDFSLPLYIFTSDPFTPLVPKLIAERKFHYFTNTPTKVKREYKGAYWTQKSAIFISNTYFDHFKEYAQAYTLKGRCNVNVTSSKIRYSKNEFGLNVYE